MKKNMRVHNHSKKIDSSLLISNLSFEGVCLDHMSKHPFVQRREEVCLTLIKLDGPIFNWHNTNIIFLHRQNYKNRWLYTMS